MIGGPSIAAGCTSQRPRQPIRLDQVHRAVGAGGRRALVGSVGDSYDDALAETINGLHKAEIIHRRGPWRSLEAVEFATLEWVDWFKNRRLLEPIATSRGRSRGTLLRHAGTTCHGGVTSNQMASDEPGAVHCICACFSGEPLEEGRSDALQPRAPTAAQSH